MPDRVLSVSDLLADVGKCTVIVDGILRVKIKWNRLEITSCAILLSFFSHAKVTRPPKAHKSQPQPAIHKASR